MLVVAPIQVVINVCCLCQSGNIFLVTLLGLHCLLFRTEHSRYPCGRLEDGNLLPQHLFISTMIGLHLIEVLDELLEELVLLLYLLVYVGPRPRSPPRLAHPLPTMPRA